MVMRKSIQRRGMYDDIISLTKVRGNLFYAIKWYSDFSMNQNRC